MKSYEIKPFEKDNYCLCVALQAIFHRHGLNLTQQEIANNLTPSRTGFYADDERMRRFLESKGFEYTFFFQNATPFNERDSFLQEIHTKDGIIGINSHFYLLSDFNYPNVRMIDTTNGRIVEKEFFDLTKEMARNDGFFGLIKRMS